MPAKKTESTIPADVLALYEKLVATSPDVARKGATMPYTSYNGHMFSYLAADGSMALRLSKEDIAAFISKYKTEPVMAHGVVMKEYVAVPADLLKRTKELKKYFDQSLAYIQTLKAKPTKKK